MTQIVYLTPISLGKQNEVSIYIVKENGMLKSIWASDYSDFNANAADSNKEYEKCAKILGMKIQNTNPNKSKYFFKIPSPYSNDTVDMVQKVLKLCGFTGHFRLYWAWGGQPSNLGEFSI